MGVRLGTAAWFCGLALILAQAFPARAQSSNAAPDLSFNDAAFDPSKIPSFPDAAKQALANANQLLKSGESHAYVFVASPDLSVWQLNGIPKSAVVYSLADTARVTLQVCEYAFGAPCFILALNGHDTQERAGGWAAQPSMFFRGPSDFDASTVPFILSGQRAQMDAYRRVPGNRAFVVTTGGGWLSRTGDTILKAITAAETDCATVFKNATCVLYAVNDRVVFTPTP